MEPKFQKPVTLPLTPSPYESEEGAPPITVNGTALPADVYEETGRWQRPTHWLSVSLWLLLITSGVLAAAGTMMYVGAVESAFLWAMLPVTFGVALIGQHYHRRALRQKRVQARRLYTAAMAGGVVTTVYADRVEQRSARWQQTLFFGEATRFVESERWLLVENGEDRAVIAAADVTPWEAQAIYEHIARAIPPERQYAVGRFAARCVQSSPPPFSQEAPMCYERVVYRAAAHHGVLWPSGLLPWLFAVSLNLAGMWAMLFAFTPLFFVDYLLYFTVCFLCTLAASVVVLLCCNPRARAEEIALSFTSEGLLIERCERQQFAAAADIYARRTADGVRLFTPAGVFTVPWSAVQQRQQLEWMLFHQRPSSF